MIIMKMNSKKDIIIEKQVMNNISCRGDFNRPKTTKATLILIKYRKEDVQ